MSNRINRVTGQLAGVLLASALFTVPAQAGALFQYAGTGDRADDVYGFIQFKVGIPGTPGDSWTIDDVDSFSLSIAGTTYGSPESPGLLADGPGIFGANNPFANFSIPDNLLFFQNAGGQLLSGTTVIELTALSSSLLLFPANNIIGQYLDTTNIQWSRAVAPVVASEPAAPWLLLGGLLLFTATTLVRRPRLTGPEKSAL